MSAAIKSCRKVFYLFFWWEAVALILGWIAFMDHNIFAAFLSGALMMAALGDASDKLRALRDST